MTTELDGTPEKNTEENLQAEIDRLDTILSAMPEIEDKDPEKINEKMQIQEQLCSTKAKLFESLDADAKSEFVDEYIKRQQEVYEELILMGMPVEPITVWEDIFGESTSQLEMSTEIENQIQEFLDGLLGEDIEIPEE